MAKRRYEDDDDEIMGFSVDGEHFDLSRWPDGVELSYWQPKPVDWLWAPYVPAGALTLLSGATGSGKTYLALTIAASVAPAAASACALPAGVAGTRTGMDRPIHAAGGAGVIFLTLGNDPERLLRPRFDKLGGDPGRLHLIRGFTNEYNENPEFSALEPKEITDALPALIRKNNARLLVIDPYETYLGTSRGRGAKATMERIELLSLLAENTRCTVLLIGTTKPSAALSATVRSELVAGFLPGEESVREGMPERGLVQVKSNLGPLGRPLRYAIDAGDCFCWRGESGISDAGLLTPDPNPEKRVALREAMEFIRTELAAGPLPAVNVLQAAKDQGISEATLRRAKSRLGVGSKKDGQANWNWLLPAGSHDGDSQMDSRKFEKCNDHLDSLESLYDSMALTASA